MQEDAEAYRARSRDRWERAAEGWGAHHERWDAATRPVSDWLLSALDPRPGQHVLELAAGPGDVGLLIAERVKPDGRVLVTDGAEAMVDVAAARIRERDVAAVAEAKVMEAEWIDAAAASLDAVACRWGYMLLADPDAALRETRRVLKPGGRVALAAWAAPEDNPWSSAIGRALVEHGLVDPTPPGEPGQFAWRDRAAIAERLADAGFFDVRVDSVPFTLRYASLDDWWDTQIDFSMTLRDALADADPAARDEVMETAYALAADHVQSDGAVVMPAATHVAAAEA